MPGVSKDEWMQVVAFCYPLAPPVEVRTWRAAALLLKVGGQFDMPLVMDKAGQIIVANVQQLYRTDGPGNVWKWLRLADQHNLAAAVRAVVRRTVVADRFGCMELSSMEGLSLAAVKQLVLALVPASGCFACVSTTETHTFRVERGDSIWSSCKCPK
jgi:hypothetical protein